MFTTRAAGRKKGEAFHLPPVPQFSACLVLVRSVLAEHAEVASATQNLAALADDARAVLAGVKLGGAGGVVAHS